MADFNDWSISSSTDTELSGVTPGGSPGEYIFIPPNDREKNIYTIMYSHNGVTGKTEYIVSSADCYTDECATDLIPPTVCFDPNQEQYDEQDSCIAMTVSHEPGNAKTIFTLGKCWKYIGASYPNQISNVTTDAAGGTSTIYYKQNSEEGNIESVVTYKFKNETANVTGQSDVIIIQEPNPCITATCLNAPTLSKNPTTKASSTGDTVTISYSSLGECWRVDSKKIREGYEQYATLDDNNVVHVNPNTGSTADTSIMVDYVFVNKATNYPCQKEIEIIQEEGCSCDDVTYVEVVTAFTHEGGTDVIGYLTTCRRDLTTIVVKDGSEEYISSGPTIAQEPQSGVYPVSIGLKPNTSTTDTNHVKYQIQFNGQPCKPGTAQTDSYTIDIEPKPCFCTDDVVFEFATDDSEDFPMTGTGENFIYIGKVVKSNICDVSVVSKTAGLNVIMDSNLNVSAKVGETTAARILRFEIQIGGETCESVPLYQQCYRGTDNGNTEYIDGDTIKTESHPILLCYIHSNGELDRDADSIIVEGGAEIVKPDGTTARLDITSGFSCSYPNGQTTSLDTFMTSTSPTFTDWLFVDMIEYEGTETRQPYETGICGLGTIRYMVRKNTTSNVREYDIILKSVNQVDPVIAEGITPEYTPETVGQPACTEWVVPIKQAPQGKKWCKCCSREERRSVLVDMNADCRNTCNNCPKGYDYYSQWGCPE